MINELNPNDMFIWFDPETDLVDMLTDEEFKQRIEEFKQAQKNWENVIAD